MKFPTTGGSHIRDERGKLTQVEAPTKPAPAPGDEPASEVSAEPEASPPAKPKGGK